jgi:SAM-dependent methyltransferase
LQEDALLELVAPETALTAWQALAPRPIGEADGWWRAEHEAPRFERTLPGVDLRGGPVLVLETAARTAAPFTYLRLYLRGRDEQDYPSQPALVLPVRADGTRHRYVVPVAILPRPMRSIWKRAQAVTSVLVQPISDPGAFRVDRIAIGSRKQLAGIEPTEPAFVREALAAKYLKGRGIEIGALQDPLSLPEHVHVDYVDRLSKSDLIAHYPELPAGMLVEPTILDDGERLGTIRSGSLGFCLANHVLEHVRDPLGTLRHWLRVLERGGIAYVTVPDRSNRFDANRQVTTLAHLVDDARRRWPERDHEHFLEWARHAQGVVEPEAAERRARELEAMDYSIHFHVFDRPLFERVLERACEHGAQILELSSFDREGCLEHIAILRRGKRRGFVHRLVGAMRRDARAAR